MRFVFACVHIGPKDPLLLCAGLVHCSQADLVRFKLKSWAELFGLHIFVVDLSVHVMPERNEVITIREGHEPLALNLRHREQMFQNIDDTITDLRVKPVEYQMGVCF